MNISISRDGVVIGAWTEEEVRTFYKEGNLVATDYCWKEGMAEWTSLGSFIETTSPPATTKTTSPEQSVEKPNLSQDENKKKSPIASSPIFTVVGAIIGWALTAQFPDQSRYIFWGCVIDAALGVIPYCIGRFYLKTSRLKQSIGIGLLAGAILGLVLSPLLLARDVDSALQTACVTINKKCPMMVDSITRLDSASSGPGRRLCYHYTLIGDTVYDPEHVKEKLTPVLIKGWQKNPSIKIYRDYKVTLEYDYSYENGSLITSIVFNAADIPE